MVTSSIDTHAFSDALAQAWTTLDTQLSRGLSGALGISYTEYRILTALSSSPNRQASRVDLAAAVGMTPSGVTRALKPLEKIGMVENVKNERDARQSLAALTRSGNRTAANGAEIITDHLQAVLSRSGIDAATLPAFTTMLEQLARA